MAHEEGDNCRQSSPLPASVTQHRVSTGVYSRESRGTVSEPKSIPALRSKWYRFISVLRRSCFIFQFGISTTLPSCDIEIILLAEPKILVDMAAFIPELKHPTIPAL